MVSMPITSIDAAQAAPGFLEGDELIGQTNADIHKKDPKKTEDVTFLEGALSWAAVGFSAFSLALFGEKLPMYENSSAGQWISKQLSGDKKPKVLQFFHNFTKNAANVVLAVANIGLLSFNGSIIPLFPGTVTSDYIKEAGKSLKEGWETLENKKYIGGIFKGLAYLNKKKNILINSKATRNVAGFCLGLLVAGTGPWGVALVTFAVTVDVTKGAYDVNRTNVLRDELEHLRSLKASIEKMAPDYAKKLNLSKTINPDLANRSELHSALKQSALPTIIGQGALIAGVAFNPASAAVMIGEAVGTGMAILGNKFTEESARSRMEAEIIKLRQETGANYNYDQSRKYDLAEIAFQAAVLAGTSEDKLKADPLFSGDKLAKPKGLWRVTSALKSCIYNIGNYIHPFKEPTNCVTFVVNDIEKIALGTNSASKAITKQPSSPALSPSPSPRNLQAHSGRGNL